MYAGKNKRVLHKTQKSYINGSRLVWPDFLIQPRFHVVLRCTHCARVLAQTQVPLNVRTVFRFAKIRLSDVKLVELANVTCNRVMQAKDTNKNSTFLRCILVPGRLMV